MKVSVIGAGYVGLVSGACFAKWGHQVHCIDVDARRIEMLNQGRMPIYEPGLDLLVQENTAAGRLSFGTEYDDTITASEVVLIAVGTPAQAHGDQKPDLSAVLAAVESVRGLLGEYAVIALKSTVPVGTSHKVAQVIAGHRPQASFAVVSNPEFLREGRAVEDFLYPDRIIIGADDDKSLERMRLLYRPLLGEDIPALYTSAANAELIKYAANALLATKVGFINEIADLCEALSLDIDAIEEGVGMDARIGRQFLHAGPGFGGSCLPKDVSGLLSMAREKDVSLGILERVHHANEQRKARLFQRVRRVMGEELAGKTATLLGLTFKAETDDVRYSPCLDLVPALCQAGVSVRAYDPKGMEHARQLLPAVEYCADAYTAARGADILILHTEWREFSSLDWGRLRKQVATPLVYDIRNFCDPGPVSTAGFDYFTIGKPPRYAASGG